MFGYEAARVHVTRCYPSGPMAWELVLTYDGMERLPRRYAWTERGARRKAARILRRHNKRESQKFTVG